MPQNAAVAYRQLLKANEGIEEISFKNAIFP